MFGTWTTLAVDTTLLGLEAQSVVGMRLSQIALGRGTAEETQLMVTEKVSAFVEAATTVATGGSAHTVIEDYRNHVRANARRLGSA